jgi:hypothetical protein
MHTRDSAERIQGWLSGRLPADWFEGEPELTIDRDEIVIVGRIPAPRMGDEASDVTRSAILDRSPKS